VVTSSQVIDSYGRPERTRTADLYRVNVAPLSDLQTVGLILNSLGLKMPCAHRAHLRMPLPNRAHIVRTRRGV
jgi:hypothetical protein